MISKKINKRNLTYRESNKVISIYSDTSVSLLLLHKKIECESDKCGMMLPVVIISLH